MSRIVVALLTGVLLALSGAGTGLAQPSAGDGLGAADPGHPGPGDRLGTKKDAQDQLALLQSASSEMKKLAQDGKCWDTAEKELKLSGYESWPGYTNNLEFIARRYCAFWGRGT